MQTTAVAHLSSEGVEKRRLAAARRSHDGKQSPGPRLAAHAIQDPFFAVACRNRHVLFEVGTIYGRGEAGGSCVRCHGAM